MNGTRRVLSWSLGLVLLFSAAARAEGLNITVEVLRAADTNLDNQVSFEELHALLPLLSQEMFDEADKNDDGFISAADFTEPPDDPRAVLLYLLEKADQNGDNKITFEEAKAVILPLTQEMFNHLDHNSDGFLTADDLPPRPVDPVAALHHLLENADTNDDGAITFAEAQALVPAITPEAFDFLDRNDDDVLTHEDLPATGGTGPLQRLINLILQADEDDNGQVTLEEILTVFPEFTEEEFAVLDQNDDGVLTLADLPTGPHALEDILAFLRQADANDDLQVTFEELQALLPQISEALFNQLDRDGDGVLDRDDLPGLPVEHPYLRLLHLLGAADANDDHQLTLAEVQAIIPTFTQHAFDYLDTNNDGVLSADDLPDGPPAGPEEMLLHLLRMADADDNQQVTFEELQALLPELTHDHFDKLDRNGDGVISRDDLPPFPHDTFEQLIRLLRDADEDGDLKVTFEELQALVPDLTQEQFDKLDVNGDGVISADDFPEPPVDIAHRILRLLHEADEDENGEVTFAELQAVVPELTQETFDRLDVNDDGVISKEDLPEHPLDPREWLRRLFHDADTNDDGKLTFEEASAALPELTQGRFDQLDRNGDGVLSAEDLPDGPIPTDDFGRLEFLRALVRADLNQNGLLEYDEIAQAFPDAPAELLGRIDTNDDWAISREELRAALEQAVSGGLITPAADVDADGDTNAIDVQATVNAVLGVDSELLPPDINGDDDVNAVDVQSTVNAVLGVE